jgi:hypothetical protein
VGAALDRYNALKAAFDIAAVSYNKYLADLITLPKEKPEFVKRPDAPSKPFAYTGL